MSGQFIGAVNVEFDVALPAKDSPSGAPNKMIRLYIETVSILSDSRTDEFGHILNAYTYTSSTVMA